MDTTVGEIAALVGGSVVGESALRIAGLNGIKQAQPGELTFLGNRSYLPFLESTQATAIFVTQDFEEPEPAREERAFIRVKNPYHAFVRIIQEYAVRPDAFHPQGIHPTAVIGNNVTLGKDVALDAHVCIADDAVIGDAAVLYAGCYVGRGSRIGAGTVLYPNVVLREGVVVGSRCILHAGVVIGADGFGFAPVGGKWFKIPQTGIVILGDDVEIGANSAVDRATFGCTVVGRGTKIDNLVQIGHNVEIGEDSVISGMTGVAGSATIGNHVIIAGQVGVADHSQIGDGVTIGTRSGVFGSVEPGAVVSGYPLVKHKQDLRIQATIKQLPEWPRRIRDLERRIETLEEGLRGKPEDHSD